MSNKLNPKPHKLKKGEELFHIKTKEKIIFGSWNEDNTASCLSSARQFLTISREDIETNYKSYRLLEKEAKIRRRGQAW